MSYKAIEDLNAELSPSVKNVTQSTDFFSYYRLNLYNRVCPFWKDDNGMCGNRACAVDTLDNEEDIPLIWRAEELSKLQGPQAKHPSKKEQKEKKRPLEGNLTDGVAESCVVEYDDECDERDYCIPEDESASSKGDYVSLLDNPEKFTGYSGDAAHMIWDAIYEENCFSKHHDHSIPMAAEPTEAANALRSVLQANSDDSSFPIEDTCLEERVFYRVISGMHASISTHLCYNYLDQKTGMWSPNVTCYEERLEDYPDRLSNLYFNYALVLRAFAKLNPYLQSYTFCSGDVEQDLDTKRKVLAVAGTAAAIPSIFDESIMFQDSDALELKDDFRNRFRNVSRLMDCVGCDKCRLWGKVQTAGYGTALKILFEFDEAEDFVLKRTELVALLNTLDRIGTSITALRHFRQMKAGKARKPSSLSPSRSEIDEFASFDPVINEEEEQQYDDPELSMRELFWEETRLVFGTAGYILREWFGLPKKLMLIALYEMDRSWDVFIGRRREDRQYEFVTPPRRDEL